VPGLATHGAWIKHVQRDGVRCGTGSGASSLAGGKGLRRRAPRKRPAILGRNRVEPDRREPVVIYVKSGVATLTP